MNTSILAIGWDVRGWLGKQQAVAVLKLNTEHPNSKTEWWVSDDFQFEKDSPLNLASLIKPALGDNYQSFIDNADSVVIGIDAPLAFPKAFKAMLNGDTTELKPAGREIDNPLAYRDCERWVHQMHGKKPLSAAFDKLGNGATLAMSVCHGLRRDGFSLLPQEGDQSDRAVIEVYPGIVKQEPKRASPAIDVIHRLVPAETKPGTDRYDAALCAIVAAVYAGAGGYLGLPELIDFQPGFDRSEGWVYSLPPKSDF
jgi:predicted nuclease with RNAse H fold